MNQAAMTAARTHRRHLLVFDTAYNHRMLVERNIASIVTGRDHGGWFDHVWTVHPVAGLLEPEDAPSRFGRPVVHQLAERHTFIEGKFGRFAFLRRFEKLNFVLAQIGLLWTLLRIGMRNPIRIIRAEEVHFCGPMALFLRFFLRAPLLVGVWGNPRNQREQTGRPLTPRLFRTIKQEEAVERFVLRRADRVMVQNEDNRAYVLGLGIPRERTALFRVGNAIERQHFTDPADRPDGSADLAGVGGPGWPTLLTIARLQQVKLVDHVIRAVRILKDRGRDVKALLAGEGVYRDELEALARELDVADRTVFLGSRDQDWLWRVVPKVTMIVSPVTGRAMAEAALAGAPIVAYDIDWQGEIVETGVTGELVPGMDYVKMADAIQRFLDDPAYARRMGDAVRNRALDMLDPEKNDRDQIRVYEELIDRRDPARRGAAASP